MPTFLCFSALSSSTKYEAKKQVKEMIIAKQKEISINILNSKYISNK